MSGIGIAIGLGASTATALSVGAGVAGLAAAGVGAVGASKASKAQKQVAGMQAEAARDTSEAQLALGREQMQMQKEMLERQIGLQEPFRQAGLGAQNRLLTLLGLPGGEAGAADYGAFTKPFTMADYQADPGYAFRMSEGMKALQQSAAARGGLLSGSTLKGIERFGQDLASQEYQNAFNRYYTQRQAVLNPLQAFLGQGQSAVNAMGGNIGGAAQGMAGTYGQMGQAYGQLGQNLGAAYGNLGQARASGYVGMANAAMGGAQSLGGFANQYAQNQMMMSLLNRGGVSPSTYAAINAGLPTGIDWSSPASYAGY